MAECMKFCPEYHNTDAVEKERLDKIVADSLEYMREHGEIADTFFDEKVDLLVFSPMLSSNFRTRHRICLPVSNYLIERAIGIGSDITGDAHRC